MKRGLRIVKKTRSNQNAKKSIGLAYLLGWLMPGAGHWYAGYKVKAISLFALITGLFMSGLMMKGGILMPGVENLRSFVFQDLISLVCAIGRIGVGFPWLVTLFTDIKTVDMLSRFGEIGACYTTVAGLLNFLVIFSIGNLFQEKQ